MSNQEKRQQSVRAVTGTSYFYEDDWHALFDSAGVADGFFNERMKAWINTSLGTSYQFLGDAQKAYAVSQGFTSWAEMGTFTPGGGSGPTGNGILLEDGTSFLLAENGNYLILEQ